jgi:hypothetical protein
MIIRIINKLFHFVLAILIIFGVSLMIIPAVGIIVGVVRKALV